MARPTPPSGVMGTKMAWFRRGRHRQKPARVLQNFGRGSSPSPRELEILALVAEGLTNKKIGERLFISEETVKTHLIHIRYRLGAKNRAHAVSRAIEEGWLTVPSQESSSSPSPPSPRK